MWFSICLLKDKKMMLVVIAVPVFVLISFLIYRNMRDEKKFEKDINEEQEHPLPSPVEEEKRM